MLSDHIAHGNRSVGHMLERQLRNLEFSRLQHRDEHRSEAPVVHEFITLSREVGAPVDPIAGQLSQRLGWPCFDHEILTAMAADNDARARLYAALDEHDLSWLEETLRGLMDRDFHKNDYFRRLSETVLALARNGPGIFIGRGADLILPRGHGLRLRIVAPWRERVERYAHERHVSETVAAAQIRDLESQQHDWIRHHFRVDVGAERFDLGINAGMFDLEQAVDLILHGLKLRGVAQATAPAMKLSG